MSLFKGIFVEELEVRNPLVLVHAESATTGGADDTHDIGLFGQYWDGTNVVYTGLFRDASDAGKYKLFDTLQVLPTVDTGVVNTAGAGYALATLDVNGLNASGNVVVTGDLTVSGTTTTINVSTLSVEDNIIIANSGPSNQKEDGGFVVKRVPANVVVGDTPKQTGTASASGTTTTVALQAGNGHGTTLNYYKGWIVKFGGDVTGTATVLSSTAANPPVLTFDTAASAGTTTSSTYQLFNKSYVGTIYDESIDQIVLYGFPREDTEAVIDPAGSSGNGNLADYLDLHINNLVSEGTITAPSLNITDNIFPINTDGTAADGGFVLQRALSNVILDTAKQSGTATAGVSTTSFSLETGAHLAASAVANYYAGWAVKVTGTGAGSSYITSSTAADPVVLTLETALGGTPNGTSTYDLYNKRFVGTIYDEATDSMTMVGFPREAGVTDISTTDVNGNLADYLNLTTAGSISSDNITAVNTDVSKNDGGFVVQRKPANIVAADTVKQSGTASASGTTTTITLQAANGHGTVLDYYKGWIIKFGGDVTGTATVTTSSAADPPVLTFDTAASGSTSTSTTYQLFNKSYVGTIYDESKDALVVYGFPREVGEDNIDLLGDSGDGNLADYADFIARAVTANGNLSTTGNLSVSGTSTLTGNTAITGDLSVGGSVSLTDNILPVTATSAQDGGFVVKRAVADIITDTALQTGTASASGTTTTVTLQAANGHGTALDFYEGWVIKFGGDVTGSATVLSSTAADPPVLTFDTAASGSTSTSTTYELFNKRYVGSIWDDSVSKWVSIGFPRELGEATVDATAGNIPSYLDVQANNATFNNVTINGTLTLTTPDYENFITVTGPTTLTASQIQLNTLIYVDPNANNDTFTLPAISALNLASGELLRVTIVNIDAGNLDAIIAANGANTIEGDASFKLKSLYMKFTLVATFGKTAWLIE